MEQMGSSATRALIPATSCSSALCRHVNCSPILTSAKLHFRTLFSQSSDWRVDFLNVWVTDTKAIYIIPSRQLKTCRRFPDVEFTPKWLVLVFATTSYERYLPHCVFVYFQHCNTVQKVINDPYGSIWAVFVVTLVLWYGSALLCATSITSAHPNCPYETR